MSINWNKITKDDILEAIELFDNNQPEYGNPRGLFLIFNGKKYPAKVIRRLAYNLKYEDYITDDQFKGGSYTIKFFNKYGFDMEYNNMPYYVNNKSSKTSTLEEHKTPNKKLSKDKSVNFNNKKHNKRKLNEKIKISGNNVLEQKNALQLLLNKLFNGDLVNERSFEWMRTPSDPKNTYPELYESLMNYRGDKKFARKNYKLPGCDFVSESNKIIIEYDERQHFTEPRRLSLLNYPYAKLYYNKEQWIKVCEDIQAIDNSPYNRDEIRAYYDSIRDIEAYNHGYKLIRIMHEEFDFERDDAYDYLKQLINNYLANPIETKKYNKRIKNRKFTTKPESAKTKKSPKYQKNALQLLLNKVFDNDVICEKPYDWMKTPKNPQKYSKLYNSLKKYAKGKITAKPDYRLHCDFVSESNKIIIEYDERAHFTEARGISLLNYPNIKFNYDKDKWIKSCEETQAKANSKYNSDVNRAYYDSIRDIEAYNHGYKLIRIKDGEFDFTRDDAYEYIEHLIKEELYFSNSSSKRKEVLNNSSKKKKSNFNNLGKSDKSNIDLKIGMYIQSEKYKYEMDLKSKMKEISNEDFDILVFPEFCYVPFATKIRIQDLFSKKWYQLLRENCLKFSKQIDKAVVISLEGAKETYFSVFANYFAKKNESKFEIYFKHTMSGTSPFEWDNYNKVCKDQFPIINYKGYKLGLTICNDGNHAPFSRMYGLQDVDVIINSSGGNVKYKKWYTYHKTRSIENNCFSLVTMGSGSGFKNDSYTYGFNPNGGYILPINLHLDEDVPSTDGEVYIYDLSNCDMNPKPEKYLKQRETPNKYKTFKIPKGNIDSLIDKSKKIKDNIYQLNKGENNIIFITIDGFDIFKPELVIPYLYDKKLSKIKNKKYILVNKFEGELDEEFYENYLSVLLKARTTENYITLILESDNIKKCYQPTNNHDAQVVKSENGIYHVDIKRASGPEAIWKNKRLMKKEWRKGFEILVKKMVDIS